MTEVSRSVVQRLFIAKMLLSEGKKYGGKADIVSLVIAPTLLFQSCEIVIREVYVFLFPSKRLTGEVNQLLNEILEVKPKIRERGVWII